MQDRFSSIIIFLIIVLSILHSGEALKCYYCAGTSNCVSGPYDEMKCTNYQPICVKFTVEENGQTAVGRTCGVSNACDLVRDIVKTCDECSTDLCNGSADNAVSTTLKERLGYKNSGLINVTKHVGEIVSTKRII